MIRSIISSILVSAALLGATGAHAQTPGGYFVATPVAQPAKTNLMTRDTPWNFRDGAFVAAQSPMREMVACQLVARSAGELSSFSAGGKAFDGAALGECNSKAKGAKLTMAKAGPTPANAN